MERPRRNVLPEGVIGDGHRQRSGGVRPMLRIACHHVLTTDCLLANWRSRRIDKESSYRAPPGTHETNADLAPGVTNRRRGKNASETK